MKKLKSIYNFNVFLLKTNNLIDLIYKGKF